ncbi:MAG: hypothetical protein ACO268_09880, partial [Opitutales bacterium]
MSSAPPLTGLSFIGFSKGRPGGRVWRAFDPAAGAELPESFHTAQPDEVERAAELAAAAAPALGARSGKSQAAVLRALADREDAGGDHVHARGE